MPNAIGHDVWFAHLYFNKYFYHRTVRYHPDYMIYTYIASLRSAMNRVGVWVGVCGEGWVWGLWGEGVF